MTATSPNDATRDFLAAIYAHRTPGTVLNLFTLDRATGHNHIEWAHTVEELAAKAHARADECVWFGVAPRYKIVAGRGRAKDCAELTAAYADIDVEGPTHKHGRLPPTIDAAHDLIADHPIAPSLIVHTGGGLQPWWIFDQPLPNTEATEFLDEWGATWAALAERRGWHLDNVFDLPRIMRLPGTNNTKAGE